jgi:SAM-dependent methyltransferase
MTSWQRWFEDKLRILAEADHVIDIGGGRVTKRHLFRSYQVVDVNAAYKPDILADIQELPMADGSVGAALCLEVLEHVEDPFKAVAELHRVLKPGAMLLVSVPFIWPYHAAPGLYQDFWRFTPDGLRRLFKGFRDVEIVKKGGYVSAMAEFVPSFLGIYPLLRPVAAWLDDHVPFFMRRTSPGHLIFMRK